VLSEDTNEGRRSRRGRSLLLYNRRRTRSLKDVKVAIWSLGMLDKAAGNSMIGMARDAIMEVFHQR